ncbi:hypothetical protein LPJ66_008589 [Kickxella alabastrina]|uniref:Uncharacterized protein n=1 Tax=Kickxella alabastrina TaxID=61397 RepID=A0ACC1IBV0_9FUNG|nr:hypothetical protein LPJ66_008589 [Kickxella alabastrina]
MDSATTQVISHVRSVLKRLRLSDQRLLLAVSGGADSMALAFVVSQAAGAHNCHAVTVDHRLRAESASEAAAVERYMRRLGITHETRALHWAAHPPAQRLEEAARAQRYAELSQACRQQGISCVITGHHGGDQAETFLLRLLRHSGVYGLAAMPLQAPLPTARGQDAQVVVRPLLGIAKPQLYALCRRERIPWHEDPSNASADFRRNALRRAIAARELEPRSPIAAPALLRVCAAMQRHRAFINLRLAELLRSAARFDAPTGTVELSAGADTGCAGVPRWAANPALRERLLAAAVGWVGCSAAPPELAHLDAFARAIAGNAGCTAGGVTLLPPTTKRGWLLCRQPPRSAEIAAVAGVALGGSALWDSGRLLITVDHRGGSAGAGNRSWSAHSLDDAMRQWHAPIEAHRHWLKGERRLPLPLPPVLAGMPVVCVSGAPVFALGCAVEAALRDVSVNVRSARSVPFAAGTPEEIVA